MVASIDATLTIAEPSPKRSARPWMTNSGARMLTAKTRSNSGIGVLAERRPLDDAGGVDEHLQLAGDRLAQRRERRVEVDEVAADERRVEVGGRIEDVRHDDVVARRGGVAARSRGRCRPPRP